MNISSKAFREKNLELPRSIDVVVLGKRAKAASQCPSLQAHSINSSMEARGLEIQMALMFCPHKLGWVTMEHLKWKASLKRTKERKDQLVSVHSKERKTDCRMLPY
ncbi:hypothetical protein Drorol1_Dr00021153 [Drosera rotundifolia]